MSSQLEARRMVHISHIQGGAHRDFHHADAYTAYGLIVAGKTGLSMLTVRAGDQFCLACEGELRIAGELIGYLSMVRVGAGERAPSFQSGPAGAAILVLQMLRPTFRAGSDVRELDKRCLSSYRLPEGAVIDQPD